MQYVKRFLIGSVFSAAVLGLVMPTTVLAEKKAKKFTASSLISNKTIRALNNSASKYLKSGEIHEVSFSVPTKHGATTCSVIPHNDSAAANLESYIVGKNGQAKDPSKVVQFKTTDAGNDFCRFTLITQKSGKIQKRDILGFVRNRGVVYNINGKKSKAAEKAQKKSDEQVEYSVSEVTADEVKAVAAACGISEAAHSEHVEFSNLVSGDLTAPEAAAAAATSNRVVKLATEADREYFNKYGANANARILGMVDGLNGVYAALNIRFEVVYQQLWSIANDPYTKSDPSGLLNEFTSYWENFRRGKAQFNVNSPGLVHLFTGRDLDGNVIGIAWIGTVCSNYGYGVSSDWSSSQDMVMLVAAHEIGHNFSLRHDTQIMGPSLTGSRVFSAASKTTAIAYINGKSEACLSRDNNGPSMLSVTGRVTANSANGAPLEGIIIDGGNLGEAITSTDGTYSFTNIPYATSVALNPMAQDEGNSFSPAAFGGKIMNDTSVNFVMSEQGGNPTPPTPGSGKKYAVNGYVRFAEVAKRVSDVTVTLVNNATGETFSAKSGSSGQYSFKNVKPGNYTISAQRGAGYIISRASNSPLSIVQKSVNGEVFSAKCASGYSVNKKTRTCDAN